MDGFEKLKRTKVLVCGAGGVGGACIEVLCRSGIGEVVVIDRDKFEITNQNRQIGSENLGMKKSEYFSKKYPNARGICAFIDSEFLGNFDFGEFDFVVDAIDDMRAKIALAKRLGESGRFIASMGGAKKLDATMIELASVWQTSVDPLAKKYRYELKKAGFKGDFPVVFTKETPNCVSLGSFMGVTATFGNFLASWVVREILKG